MPFYYGSRARSVPEYLKLRFDEKTRGFNAISFALMTVLYFAPLRLGSVGLDIHSMLYASAGAMLGMQLCLFALFARVSAQNAGLLPRQPGLDRLLDILTLERGLLIGRASCRERVCSTV